MIRNEENKIYDIYGDNIINEYFPFFGVIKL